MAKIAHSLPRLFKRWPFHAIETGILALQRPQNSRELVLRSTVGGKVILGCSNTVDTSGLIILQHIYNGLVSQNSLWQRRMIKRSSSGMFLGQTVGHDEDKTNFFRLHCHFSLVRGSSVSFKWTKVSTERYYSDIAYETSLEGPGTMEQKKRNFLFKSGCIVSESVKQNSRASLWIKFCFPLLLPFESFWKPR